jgi:hypothetical protein
MRLGFEMLRTHQVPGALSPMVLGIMVLVALKGARPSMVGAGAPEKFTRALVCLHDVFT